VPAKCFVKKTSFFATHVVAFKKRKNGELFRSRLGFTFLHVEGAIRSFPYFHDRKKRMKIKILPNVLALHLKRFKLLPAEDKYVKLAYRVAFPLELRLFNTVDDAEDPDRLYQLFATVVHIGGYVSHTA